MTTSSKIAMSIVFGFIGLVALVWLLPRHEPTPEERAASDEQWQLQRTIEVCWELYSRKSLSPETARIIAGSCEMGEEKYRVKYGRWYTKNGKKM